MRAFILVLVVATIVGGFVGGELSDRAFSLLGAVVGGVGTATVLLGLGAYFSAQEERRKHEALPPEIRQVFDRMFGSPEKARTLLASAAKWRPRPFHENRTKSEEAEWFANTPPWNRVDPRLTTLLIDRLHGDPIFEVFVHASQDCGVIAKYEPLGALFDRGVGSVAAPPRVAEILSTAGAAQGARFAKMFESRSRDQKALSRLYANAMNACEAAMNLEPNYLPSYLQLALLRSMLDKRDDAARFCNLGLQAVARLRNEPFHLSSIPTIKNAQQQLDQVEAQLRSLLASLESEGSDTSEAVRRKLPGGGAISLDPDLQHVTISLPPKPSLRTTIAAMLHLWWAELEKDATRQREGMTSKEIEAQAQVLSDWHTARRWLGVGADEPLSDEHRARLVHAGEAYVREGRAPSHALRKAFEEFRAQLGPDAGKPVELSDEMRGVMDRMFATDDEIAEATRARGTTPDGEHEA